MDPVTGAIRELGRIFRAAESKYEAHAKARPLLVSISHEPRFITEVLRRRLALTETYAELNFPTMALKIEKNADFELVLNAFIPRPGGDTRLSVNSIHHHGPLLLSSVAVFGPGYEHWLFGPPIAVDRERDLFHLDFVEAAPHALHHVNFIDAEACHLIYLPRTLAMTVCVWSDHHPTSLRDRIKRFGPIKERDKQLKALVQKLGLAKLAALKVSKYYDYYPVEKGVKAVPLRQQFPRGSNEDHLQSLFHVIQATGNDALAPEIQRHLETHDLGPSRPTVERLLQDLRRGTPIEGKQSESHLFLQHATFPREAVVRALGLEDRIKTATGIQPIAA